MRPYIYINAFACTSFAILALALVPQNASAEGKTLVCNNTYWVIDGQKDLQPGDGPTQLPTLSKKLICDGHGCGTKGEVTQTTPDGRFKITAFVDDAHQFQNKKGFEIILTITDQQTDMESSNYMPDGAGAIPSYLSAAVAMSINGDYADKRKLTYNVNAFCEIK